MSLPGLGLTETTTLPTTTTSPPRTIILPPQSEYRLETTAPLTLKLLPSANASSTGDLNPSDDPQNTAEIFGTPLAPSAPYTLTNAKAAVYSHHGCTFEITGETESEYVAEETNGPAVANVHFALETLRDAAAARLANRGAGDVVGGPRVLVVGPESAGKTSMVKTLVGYAIRAGRSPCVVSLNPHEGMLAPPASFSAAVFGPGAVLDVEDGAGGGWGSSQVAGPTSAGVRVPVVYHFGYEKLQENLEVMGSVVGRLAVAVTGRYEDDEDVKSSGLIVDLAGSVAGGGKGYEVLDHVVSELSITIILTLGSERLHSDLQRRFATTSPTINTDEPMHVVKIPTSGGAVPRPPSYLSTLRTSQIKAYFFGSSQTPLSPYTQNIDISPTSCPLTIWKLPSTSTSAMDDSKKEEVSYEDTAFKPGGFYDSGAIPAAPNPASLGQLERADLGPEMAQHLLVLKHCARDASADVVRDASVMGFLYVVDVDKERGRARVLSPMGGRLPSVAAVWSPWPGSVEGIVG